MAAQGARMVRSQPPHDALLVEPVLAWQLPRAALQRKGLHADAALGAGGGIVRPRDHLLELAHRGR